MNKRQQAAIRRLKKYVINIARRNMLKVVSFELAPDVPGPLDVEIRTYDRMKNKLLQKHNGKFVVIKGTKLYGVFLSFENAAYHGVAKFGNTPMLIRQVLRQQPVYFL